MAKNAKLGKFSHKSVKQPNFYILRIDSQLDQNHMKCLFSQLKPNDTIYMHQTDSQGDQNQILMGLYNQLRPNDTICISTLN